MCPLRTTLGLLLIADLVITASARGQQFESASVPNVPIAFEAVPPEGTALKVSSGDFKVPSGGHLQGIQLRQDPAGDRMLAFLSQDSLSVGSLVIVEFPTDFSGPGNAIHIETFPTDGEQPPLRHAGGMQLCGDYLVVGLEDNQAKTRSEVQFWNTASPASPVPLKHLTVRRAGAEKDKTAGAVGLIEHKGRYLLAVANWDCRAIDFYRSSGQPLPDVNCRFEFFKRWQNETADKTKWQPDPIGGSYQAIQLVSDARERLYLVGFDTAFPSQDVVDLFSLDLEQEPPRLLEKIVQRRMHWPEEIHFRFAAGLWVKDGTMTFLASERNLAFESKIGVAPRSP